MSIRIILVDDHQIVREGVRLILSRQSDIDVVADAENGRQAVDLSRELKPDVVVMDVAMADLNGIEATRQILVAQPEVRVIALSAYADRRYVMSILDAGARGYVLKANAAAELVRAIRAVVEGNTYLTPEVADTVVDSYTRRLTPAEASSSDRVLRQLGDTVHVQFLDDIPAVRVDGPHGD